MSLSPARPLLTCREVAELLAVKEGTVRLWIAQRRFAVVRLGRAVRVPAKAVEELIAANTVPAREKRT